MKTKRRREITYESYETTVIRYARGQRAAYCRHCGISTHHVSVAEAISILSISALAIDGLIRDRQIHRVEDGGSGPPILCGNSLELLLGEPKNRPA